LKTYWASLIEVGNTSSRNAHGTSPLNKRTTCENAFDSFAEMYDKALGKPMTFFTDLLIRDPQIPENPTVLDVGCGTGISTFELMKRVQGNGKFYGIDISQKMIEMAKARAADAGYDNAEFTKGDGERLKFPESSFDLVLSNEVFQFFLNKQKALDEMYRVLKPMGQVALLFFGESTFKEIEEMYNKVRSRHTQYTMPESLKLIDLEETRELFEKSGFKKTNIFARHEINYLDLSEYCSPIDAPTAFWRINFPSEYAETVRKEIRKEMARAKTAKGSKTTICNIIAYAQKT
jgi:ubiquinone/menaquinone biosynthesis C-methylase UbiE